MTSLDEAARQDRARSRQDEMLRGVQVGLWYCDLPFDELIWDAAVKEHFWLAADARVTIETFYARLHADDRERTRASIDRSIATHAPYDIEYRTVAPPGGPVAGRIRWVRAIGYTGYGPDGQPVRFDGITVDITAAKLSAERLAASERRYEYASLATSNAIWDWDLATDVVTWNPGVHTVFGFGPGEVVETAAWWYDHIHPEDRDRVVSGIHAVIDPVGGPIAWRDEYRFRRGDGTYAWLVDRGYVARDAAGRATHMIGAMEDVTARRDAEASLRRSEEQLRFLADAIPQLVWTTLPDGYHDYYNERWYRYTGMPRGEENGWDWKNFLHPDDVGRTLAVWGQSLATGEPYSIEYRLRDAATGAYRWFIGRALPLRDAAGRVVRWFGTCTDIQDQKETEADRDRARAEAEEANRAKGEFLARMSHDLRTPLNAIGGYAQLIEMGVHGPVTPAQAAATARIRRAQEHLLSLINDILSFAKIEAGQVRFAMQDVPLGAALADVSSLIEPLARAKGLQFEWDTPPEAVRVRADPERLQQVLANLLGNAVKFTESGGVVRLDWAEGDARGVRVRVHDSGRGIPSDRLESIFDPFVQVTRTPAGAEEGGVGLGLAISRELTRAMGGTLEVESGLGTGSTFTVTLPRAS